MELNLLIESLEVLAINAKKIQTMISYQG